MFSKSCATTDMTNKINIHTYMYKGANHTLYGTHSEDLVSESHASHGGRGSLGNEADKHALVGVEEAHATLALAVLTQHGLADALLDLGSTNAHVSQASDRSGVRARCHGSASRGDDCA